MALSTSRISSALATATVALTILAGAVPSAQAASCTDVDVPVAVGLQPGNVHGTLCRPAPGSGSTLAVLVPGGTYNSSYWDFPLQPERYSFRRSLNDRGYATLTIDRLGTGGSSRPLSVTLTAGVQAAAVHQVIGRARAGQLDGSAFSKVLLGAHSVGSGIAVIEAATYRDVDGVLLTGFSHVLAPGVVTGLATSVHPAAIDPVLGGGYDLGYLTTRPGTRGSLFYAPATADPAVVAADEATKDVLAATEAPDVIGVAVASPYSVLINAPVLLAVGGADSLFCVELLGNCASAEALRTTEKPYYSAQACLQTHVLPGAGHSINLATNTQSYHDAAGAWADAYVGATAAPPPTSCPAG